MTKSITTTYYQRDSIQFLMDDDKNLLWLKEKDFSGYDRFFVVIDKKVDKVWGNIIKKRLESHKKKIYILKVTAQEEIKSLLFYPKLVGYLEKNKCGLSDLVIAIGGGIIIDSVGFTCSTYMRGLPFMIIATTLIGMVDASTAGKTCLNTGLSKNILGTFYYPLLVYNNINFLKTNTEFYNRQGFSEMFKYGLLGSKSLLKKIDLYFSGKPGNSPMDLIEETINTRIKIRKIHPQASNLGHTFGQALEKLSDYRLLHGDAISMGTIIALEFGKKVGITKKSALDNTKSLMKKYGLNMYLESNLNIEKLVDLMMHDKKASSKFINLVLIRDIGLPYRTKDSYFYKVEPGEVKRFLKEFTKKYQHQVTGCARFIKNRKLTYFND